jgi:hypothetical protein
MGFHHCDFAGEGHTFESSLSVARSVERTAVELTLKAVVTNEPFHHESASGPSVKEGEHFVRVPVAEPHNFQSFGAYVLRRFLCDG